MSKKVYFIGIKGVGMTSLAIAMQEQGWLVSGSDTADVFITDEILAAHGIKVGLLSDSLPADINLIVCSAAYALPETQVDTMSLAEALAEFVRGRVVIAVAGVGGKTTTSAMLAALLHAAKRDVGYYVGTSTIAGLPGPGHSGTDPYFIVEADEYAVSKTDRRPKFRLLRPHIVITTNIVHDHPDIYPDENATLQVFRALIATITPGGSWICNPDDRLTAKLLPEFAGTPIKTVRYGSKHPLYGKLSLSVFGPQNRLDALAAVLASEAAGLTEEEALASITAYRGAGRRQESHGEAGGRLLYDDYGHHPAEIAVTVASFKEHFPDRRVLLVFESHTYSRTEALLGDFAKSIASADLAFVMPIFESAREKGQAHTITPASFTAEVAKHNPAAVAVTWENAAETVVNASRPGDIILTMGAGFVYKLHEKISKLLGQ